MWMNDSGSGDRYMKVIGLTGGAGAGKDEAIKVFKKFGANFLNYIPHNSILVGKTPHYCHLLFHRNLFRFLRAPSISDRR